MKMIIVVTGASRGAGKGIALALGAAGATVYVTGRSVAGGDSPYGGTVAETARLITQAGGKGIAIAVDPNHVRQPSGNRRSSPAGSSRPCTIPTRGCSSQDVR